MQLVDVIRIAHIAAGTVALSTFCVPLITKKGGVAHRRAGWAYAIAMWIATVAAWSICAFRLTDGDKSNDPTAVFLAFIGLLTANGAATGIRVLRTKTHAPGDRHLFDISSAGLLLVSSMALVLFAFFHRSVLFAAFAGLGLYLAQGQLRYWMFPRPTKMEWWYEHMGNMLTACIGTVTAFLVVNVPRLGLADYALLFWVAPGVVGGISSELWQRYYRRKFESHLPMPSVQTDSSSVA